MSNQFVYTLRGGPYDGKEIILQEYAWHEELYFLDPYELHCSSYAIYKRTDPYSGPLELVFSGRKRSPTRARMPKFVSDE